MPEEEARQQLAKVAAVADDLDRIIDKLFQNVADLKAILVGAGQDSPSETEEDP